MQFPEFVEALCRVSDRVVSNQINYFSEESLSQANDDDPKRLIEKFHRTKTISINDMRNFDRSTEGSQYSLDQYEDFDVVSK